MEKNDDHFSVKTDKGRIGARNVIVATGPFQTPFIPPIADSLANSVCQFHSSTYRRPNQLTNGRTLIIGGGNSGAQIAAELAVSREVHLSVSQNFTFLPLSLFGKSIFWWFKRTGVLDAPAASFTGSRIQRRGDPVLGYDLRQLIRDRKITVHPRTVSCDSNSVVFQNGARLHADNIIWATGFRSEYRWIDVPGTLHDAGRPVHDRGITRIDGLYFLGLPWQHKRGSALLLGVGEDAAYISSHLKKRQFG